MGEVARGSCFVEGVSGVDPKGGVVSVAFVISGGMDRVGRHGEGGCATEAVHAAGGDAYGRGAAGNVLDDVARVRDVESIRLPGEIVLYDVNRGWTRQQALRVMQATEDLKVMFEQPGETLDDIAAIRPLHSAPVSVDESLDCCTRCCA